MKYKFIDLFSGIGGLRRGFELTKQFECVLSAEIDKYACITYKHLFGDDPFNDVTSEEFKKKVENIKYDVILAGFPCQSFSIAGKKEGFRDKTRGTLFFDVADIIERTKPKAFLLENVEGLITHNKGETFQTILETLCNELNYTVIGTKRNLMKEITFEKKSFVRDTRNFGLPQKRSRTYIVGFRNDLIPSGYKFEELPKERKDLKMYKDLNDLIELNNEIDYYLTEGYLETLKKHRLSHSEKGNGFGFEVVNSPLIKNPLSNTILATGGSGKERNLIYDKQEDFEGQTTKYKKTPINKEGIRHMTPREWGKLQGFVNYAFIDENNIDKFSFPPEISKTQMYKQFGNSVSIPVIEKLAEYIYQNLSKLEEK